MRQGELWQNTKTKKQKQNLEHIDIKHIWQYETITTDTTKYDIKIIL